MIITRYEIKRLQKSMLIWAVVLGGIMVLYLLFFPSISSSQMDELLKQKLHLLPKEMQSAFNLDNLVDFSDLRQYFAYISQFLFLAADVYAIILGARILAREESERTIEFLYAQPVSRIQIVTAKLMAALITLLIFNLIFLIITVTASLTVRPAELPLTDLTATIKAVFLGQFLLQLCYLLYGLLLSACMSNASRAASLAMGLFFITYIAGILASTISSLEWMRVLSPSSYLTTSEMVQGKLVSSDYGIVMLISAAASLAAAYLQYKRKDFRL